MTRNPVGNLYKTRRGANNYAAKLQTSWGGDQSDGSHVDIVVDPVSTPDGPRFQVMCVTTRPTAPAAQPIGIGQVYRPNSGPAVDIAIVDFDGPGFYIVRNASGSGGTRSISADALANYTYLPDAYAY